MAYPVIISGAGSVIRQGKPNPFDFVSLDSSVGVQILRAIAAAEGLHRHRRFRRAKGSGRGRSQRCGEILLFSLDFFHPGRRKSHPGNS